MATFATPDVLRALLSADPVGALLALGPAFAVTGTVSVLYDTPAVDGRYASAGVGTLVTLASPGWFWYEN